jgi:hypothetical protein
MGDEQVVAVVTSKAVNPWVEDLKTKAPAELREVLSKYADVFCSDLSKL